MGEAEESSTAVFSAVYVGGQILPITNLFLSRISGLISATFKNPEQISDNKAFLQGVQKPPLLILTTEQNLELLKNIVQNLEICSINLLRKAW